MCQSQAGNSNGVECFCDRINHLSTEEWHFLAIRQPPHRFITHREGKILGASAQILWGYLVELAYGCFVGFF